MINLSGRLEGRINLTHGFNDQRGGWFEPSLFVLVSDIHDKPSFYTGWRPAKMIENNGNIHPLARGINKVN